MIVGLQHVQIAMPGGREEDAVAFYEGILGLPHVDKPPEQADRGGCWFRGEGVEVHLGVDDAFGPSRTAHPAFVVDGLDAFRTRLRGVGVDIVEEAEFGGYRRFYAHDPFGNRLEFVEASK